MPENRSDPGGRQVRVFVVRLAGNPGTVQPPAVFVGTAIGYPFDPLTLSRLADYLDGPEVIAIQERGTGFSEPNLSCPEVDSLAPAALAAPIDDPELRSQFVKAVQACHDRFVEQGVDLSAYGIEESGADLVDLVRTLGLDKWDAISNGTTSQIVFEAIRTDPTGLRAVAARDPAFPDTDPFFQAFTSTRASVDVLAALCDADQRCAERFPDLTGSFNAAIQRFDDHPRTIGIAGMKVQVDGARLLRDLRNLLAAAIPDDPMYLHLPATIDALAHDKNPQGPLAAVISPELSAPTLCTGYLPVCTTDVSQGTYYSALCERAPSSAGTDELKAQSGDERAWIAAFADSPYLDACSTWDVTPVDASATEPLSSDVPMLITSGGLDPFVSAELTRDGVARLSNAFLIAVPVRGVPFTTACPNDNSRNEFLADPTSHPNTRCIEHEKPTFAASPLQSGRRG